MEEHKKFLADRLLSEEQPVRFWRDIGQYQRD
jgi:hypothetical protein